MPTVYVDCEWGYKGRIGRESGWEPVVLCARVDGVPHHFLGRDDRLNSFVERFREDWWVAHSATAEMAYLLRLGVTLPRRWWCTMVGHRVLHNRAGRLDGDLVTALITAGLERHIPDDKEQIRDRILNLRHDPDEVVPYCFADVDAAAALYAAQVNTVSATAMRHWGEYLQALARLELRGVPLDYPLFRRIWRARPHLCAHLQQQINDVHRVYRADGSFNKKAFLGWCRREGIKWPRKISDTTNRLVHSLDDDTLEMMEGRHPFIARLRQIRKTLRVLDRYPIRVDPLLGRHFYSHMPFRSVTGRNQPSRWIFGAPKWMRWLVRPLPGHVLITADYVAQEIGAAAALSGDTAMAEMYAAPDPHLLFAIRAGAAPVGATKKSHPVVRSTYKTANLAILYGQGADGLADRLGVEVSQARDLLRQHKKLFATYHDWSGRVTAASYRRGYAITKAGWRAKVDRGSKWRTWSNFPIQGIGADVMRVTTIAMDKLGVSMVGVVHDGWVITCREEEEQEVRLAIEAARRVACDRLLDGFPLRVDVTTYADCYRDEDGLENWDEIMKALPLEVRIETE